MMRLLSTRRLRALTTAALAVTVSWAPPTPVAQDAPSPALLEQLEERVVAASQRALEVSVGLRIRDRSQAGDGSGVIVTPEGHILTVAHNFDRPGTPIDVILADGRTLRGVGLGREGRSDFALVKIADEGAGPFPFAEMGDSLALKDKELCVMTGHAGGIEAGRPAVVRVGTFLGRRRQWLRSDCVMMPGDSGGALFDLDGRVVGVNSYIEERVDRNYHVPVEPFREHWQRLVASESWNPAPGDRSSTPVGAIGIAVRETEDGGLRIYRLFEGYDAAHAGLEVDDVIVEIDGEPARNRWNLRRIERNATIGSILELTIRRGDEELVVEVPVVERRDDL